MHRDIRSFFQVKKEKKKTEDDNSDVIPESPNVKITNKKKQTRKRRQIQEDSDDEIFSSPKKKQTPPKKKQTPPKAALKEVKAADIFGSGPIKRTEPLVKKSVKETELAIHSDEEFEKSLLQIDEVDNLVNPKLSKKEDDVLVIDVDDEKSDTEINKNHDKKITNHTKNDSNKNNKDSNYRKRKFNKSNNEKSTVETPSKEFKMEKPDFSEFLNDEKINHDVNLDEPRQKKQKLDKSLNESVLSDEERHERKRYSAALYQKYLNRTGPKHLGTKEIPEGSSDCLVGCAFLLTGVLDSFERDDIVAAITKYGGSVKNSISKKVTHVLAGDDAGPAKLAKAQELGIKIINEDEFLSLIKDSTEKKPTKELKKENKVEKKSSGKAQESHFEKSKKLAQREKSKDKKIKHGKLNISSVSSEKEPSIDKPTEKILHREVKREPRSEPITNGDLQKPSEMSETSSLMWVDKYKPTNIKQIIGQHGDKSNVKKLINWLTQWYANRKAKIPKPSPWAKDDNGAYYKAALLSGPPGVGKTTTVSLVCKELGFDMVEFNASDTRSKTLIREQIGELLSTTSLSAYARGSTGKDAVSKKHVLVMDEVDGMAGNEDRGGLQELISLIKSTSVPVICMCNDRSSEKMRSLLNYCYDLRFERPRVNQIMSAMLSVCFQEGVKVPPDVMKQLIEAAGHDVRQTLHMLSVWVVDSQLMDHDRLQREAGKMKKDMKMGPWEAIRKVFSAEEHQRMSINDKSDLFFTDYSIMPLFVHENYLNAVPHGLKKASLSKVETLERLSQAGDSISLGDLVDARIRGNQAWSLLPMQAMYSSVIPGQILEGHIAGQIQFPGWLGKNSRRNKMRRLAQEIHAHTRLSTSGSKSSIFLDYSTHIRDAILNPLIRDKIDGVEQSLHVLESYNLLREDLDSLVELSLWPETRNPTVLIDPKVKAALTRTYNKTASALPYAPAVVKKGRGIEDNENSQEDTEDVEVDSDPEHDAMIKKKKIKETDKGGPSTSTGKGKNKESSASNKEKKGKEKGKSKATKKR